MSSVDRRRGPHAFRNHIIVHQVIICVRNCSSYSLATFFVALHFVQLRNKLNQEQNAKLQQQRECLNRRNSEVAVMDKRVNELRDRLWKKKAALQQKENLSVSGLSRNRPRRRGKMTSPVRSVVIAASSESLFSAPSEERPGYCSSKDSPLFFHLLMPFPV